MRLICRIRILRGEESTIYQNVRTRAVSQDVLTYPLLVLPQYQTNGNKGAELGQASSMFNKF